MGDMSDMCELEQILATVKEREYDYIGVDQIVQYEVRYGGISTEDTSCRQEVLWDLRREFYDSGHDHKDLRVYVRLPTSSKNYFLEWGEYYDIPDDGLSQFFDIVTANDPRVVEALVATVGSISKVLFPEAPPVKVEYCIREDGWSPTAYRIDLPNQFASHPVYMHLILGVAREAVVSFTREDNPYCGHDTPTTTEIAWANLKKMLPSLQLHTGEFSKRHIALLWYLHTYGPEALLGDRAPEQIWASDAYDIEDSDYIDDADTRWYWGSDNSNALLGDHYHRFDTMFQKALNGKCCPTT